MSTNQFPTLAGLGYPVVRTPIWASRIQTAISGKEVRIADQTYPRYKWEVDINVLRAVVPYSEFQTLLGFFNARQGQFDTFLYKDADDNAVTGQTIGSGDGTTTAFQLVRTLGGFVEPILAPNTDATIHVYLDGVLQVSGYTVGGWGTSTPGALSFVSAPGIGVAITADFGYFWPCRMNADQFAFSLDFSGMYSIKKLAWLSVKN